VELGVVKQRVFFEITILNDRSRPKLEDTEAFLVILHSPEGASLNPLNRSIYVVIDDINDDKPTMAFSANFFRGYESGKNATVTISRGGDIMLPSAVSMYSVQISATQCQNKEYCEFDDFVIWPNDEQFNPIAFLSGESEKLLLLNIVDDKVYESSIAPEMFRLILASPINGKIGTTDRSIVIIDDSEDKQVIEFESWKNIEVTEPESSPLEVEVPIKRHGDSSVVHTIRCSTLDGSALTPDDYLAKSEEVTFLAGESTRIFKVTILPDKELEWKETIHLEITGKDGEMDETIGENRRISIY
jgi:hypothetical protein